MAEKYYNEKEELGVLISVGYGAGWSTWNDDVELAYDKRIIQYWLEEIPSEEDMEKFIVSLGYRKPCMAGYDSLRLIYIPKGTVFCIHEYDGSETIETPETLRMMIA